MKRVPDSDLQDIYNNLKSLLPEIENKTIFITGGTGFFGKWLLDSLIYINDNHPSNLLVYVLSRNSSVFLSKYPHYEQNFIKFVDGDITKFDFPEVDIDYIIHAATEASVTLNVEQPFLMYDTIVEGTKRILELGKIKKVKAILHTSSGAVYGVQPSEITHVSESYSGSPDIFAINAAYGEGKRVAEMMAAMYHKEYDVPSKIARCFAFVGPHLPLDTHFAIGNFINDVLHNEDLIVKGDGTAYRSYMYASDLVIWLWTILFKGKTSVPYNLGSDKEITIAELANEVLKVTDSDGVVKIMGVANEKNPPQRYVPNIDRAKNDLSLKVNVPLKEAIKKTIDFYK